MAEKSIIVIGAGLAGLSTGCYAQMNGYRAHIFEHHSKHCFISSYMRKKEHD
jgi:phytoene dehydrogenase-like protein